MTGLKGQTELVNQSLNKWITSPVYDVEEYLESLSMRLFLKLLPTVMFIGVQTSVGVPGNLLIICVYLKQFRSSSTKVFILAMAMCDLLTNVVSSPLLIMHLRSLYNNVDDVGCKAMQGAWRFPTMLSVCLLVCVAFDRRRRIWFPLRRQMTARHAVYALLLSLALSALLTSPYVIMYGQKGAVVYGRHRHDTSLNVCDIQLKYIEGEKYSAAVLMVFYATVLASLVGCYVHISCKALQLKRTSTRQWRNKHPDEKSNISSSDCAQQTEPSDVENSESAPDYSINNEANKSTVIDQPSPSDDLEKQDFDSSFRSTSPTLLTLNKIPVRTPLYSCPTEGTTDNSFMIRDIISSSENTAGSLDVCYRLQAVETKQAFAEVKKGKTNPSAKRQRKQKKNYFSKTTLMMFVLTITTVIFFLPHIVLGILGEGCRGYEENPLKMNSCLVALAFPYLNSLINPFVYSFCNPKFRLHCRRFLLSLCRRASSTQ